MTNLFRFSVIPLSEVPSPVIPLSEVPSPASKFKVGSLEAVLIDDRRSVRDLLGPLGLGAIGYEVQGLPPGQKAWIVKEKEHHQVIRQRHGESEWLGKYTTTEEALQALASKLL